MKELNFVIALREMMMDFEMNLMASAKTVAQFF